MSLALDRDWSLFFIISTTAFLVAYFKPSAANLFDSGLRVVFFLAVLSFVVHILSKWWRHFTKRRTLEAEAETKLSEAELERQARQAREESQREFDAQSTKHKEKVKLSKKNQLEREEESHYRFSGPAWKGKATQLGTEEVSDAEEGSSQQKSRGSSREAASMRKLVAMDTPPPNTTSSTPPTTLKEKRTVTLPEEPDEGDDECVVVMLRTPMGRAHRRRFLGQHTMQVVLDFMQTVGYHPRLYHLSSSYPRRCVSGDPTLTLTDLGLASQVILNVEAKGDDEDSTGED